MKLPTGAGAAGEDSAASEMFLQTGLLHILACVPEVTCEPASAACTKSSQQLATSAALEELELHGGIIQD